MKTSLKILSAFLFSTLLFWIFFPELIQSKASPLFAGSWLLADPIVSLLNFIPSMDVVRYELFENSNYIWTNLRAMGAPLLSNEIMSGPLFPLTLLLIWLPGDLYWNVFICSRVILAGVGCYLLARDFLRIKPLPAIFFMFSFCYSLYVIRWMNHPWQNGFLAGIWYLYILVKVAQNCSRNFKKVRFLLLLALVIAVFSMVTCGFPTTSAFFGLIVILVYIPYIISLCINKEIHFQSLCCDLIAAHIIGFGLASYQIMSIYELFEINNTPRTGFGLIQFPLENIFSFFSINVSNITSAKPEIFYRSQTSLGLLPTTLFFIGIYAVIRHIKRISYADIGALACMIFFMLKLFPLWPGFNTFIGSIPMLAESKFRSYFFFCFLWGLAYFVAKGVTYIIEQQKISQTIITTVVFTSGLATLALLAHSLSLLNISISSFFESNMYEKGYKILWAFGSGFFFLLIGTSYKNKNRFIASACLIVILLLSIYEQLLTLPAGFNAWGSTAMTTKRVAGYLQDYSISKFDFRERSHGGNLVSAGIATINNGAPTLVPPRTMLYRNTLFNSSWKGMLPISGTKTAHSWQISSAALYPTDFFQIADYSNLPQWDRLQKVEGGKIKIESIVILSETLTKPYTLLKTNSLGTTKIQGWAVDPKVDTLEGSSVYVVLSGEHGEIVAPVKVKRRRSVVKYFKNPGYKKAGWEVHFDGNVLRAGTYSIFIRYLRPDHSTYYEKDSGKTFTVVKDGLTSETQNTPSPQLRYLGKDGKRYLYKDESVLPRAYTVARCFPVDNMGEAAKKLQNDLKFRIGDAYIENLSEDEKKFCTDNQNKLNHIPILEDKGSSVRLGPIEGPTILMLSDNIYPGWSAYDIENKQKYEVKPANIAFRAVLLPENRMYSIRFLYRPPWLTIARAAVLFSCILLSSLAFLAWRPRR